MSYLGGGSGRLPELCLCTKRYLKFMALVRLHQDASKREKPSLCGMATYADKLPNDVTASYYLQAPSGRWLVGFGGDYAESFINHSNTPNARLDWHNDVATLVAIREIQLNEEVTFDYGDLIKFC